VDQPQIVGRFEGRVAIVTGASTDPGIGTACARRLAMEGASVVINARGEERLRAMERALQGEGLSIVACAGAAGSEGVADRLVDTAWEAFGGVDLLVNTVGGVPFVGSALDLTRDNLLATVELNTWPALALIQAAMARGLVERAGAVVNISSGSPGKTTPTMAAYAAAKSALNALTRTLANDLGHRGVRVNAVSPVLTRTEATRDIWGGGRRRSGWSQYSARATHRSRGRRLRGGLPALRRGRVDHRGGPRRRRRQPRRHRIVVPVQPGRHRPAGRGAFGIGPTGRLRAAPRQQCLRDGVKQRRPSSR
jgi:3-oxoacyl-[acyl-carrier protein] reductase